MAKISESPWLTIWLRPRKAMRVILFDDLEKRQAQLAVMAAAAGFSLALDLASIFILGERYSFLPVLLGCALVGPALGLVILYGGGWLFTWCGKILNGWGRPFEVRAAIAWPLTTAIWSLLLWLPRLAIMGTETFSNATPANATLVSVLGGLAVLRVLVAAWGLGLFIVCLSEAHRFSIFYAYAAAFTGGLILTVATVVSIIVAQLLVP